LPSSFFTASDLTSVRHLCSIEVWEVVMVIGAAARVAIGGCRKLISSHTSLLLVSSQCRQVNRLSSQSILLYLHIYSWIRPQSLTEKRIEWFQNQNNGYIS